MINIKNKKISISKFILFASHANSVLNFRQNLINDLNRQSLDVHIVIPKLCSVNDRGVISKIERLGVTVHEVDLNRTGLNPILDFITLLRIIIIFRKVKPEYILSYTIKPVIYGSFAARLLGIKHCFALITGLGLVFNEGAGVKHKVLLYVVKYLYKIGLSGTEKVFFQNPDDSRLFCSLKIINVEKSCVVNGSGVDLNYYKFFISPKNKEVSFLMMARLLNSKGVRIYFEAAKNIKALYPDIIFFLAGNIDDLNNDSISKVELDSWVKSGVIDYYGSLKDVRSAIVNCSVYVLPSFYREGVPRSILEAMSTGRAIITTDTPGCRETVVNGKNGYLIAPKSAPDLVNSMLNFVKNPNIISDMGIKSREIAEEKYDVKKVNLKMLRTMKIVK